MVIGINYMITNQSPQCVDLKLVDTYLSNSFKKYLMSSPDLCCTDLQYHSSSSQVTKNFYTIDIIGQVLNNEEFYRTWLKLALFKAWSAQNLGFTNITMPELSDEFETRYGPFGSLLSRVYYTISIDGNQAITGYQANPSGESITNELSKLGSDMVVLTGTSSIQKSLLSSLFVLKYPLSTSDRLILQANINLALQQINLFSSENPFGQGLTKTSVVIYYSEFYTTQTYNNRASRVYYGVSHLG